MGNEHSAGTLQDALKMQSKQVDDYIKKYRKMEETISTQNATITTLIAEKEKQQSEIERLKEDMKRKDGETKKRIADMRNSRKTIDAELEKYRAVPEFEELLNLQTELSGFSKEVEAAASAATDPFVANGQEMEIEKLKRSNRDLEMKLKESNGMRALLNEKAAELREAEDELNAKREQARQRMMKQGMEVVQLRERMKATTAKFNGTLSNAMTEFRRVLAGLKKEFTDISKANCNDLPYDKVKNILLTLQNSLMMEILLTGGAVTNVQDTPPVLNNATGGKPHFEGKKLNVDVLAKPYTKESTSNFNVTLNALNVSSDDDSDNDFSLVDDQSEADSAAGNAKTFKLIILNIPMVTYHSDYVKVMEVLHSLTNLPLSEMTIKRFGKSTGGKPQPILACFPSMQYILDILKNRHKLKDGKFDYVKICPYKKKPIASQNQNAPPKQTNDKKSGNKHFKQKKHANKGNQDKKPDEDDCKKNFPF